MSECNKFELPLMPCLTHRHVACPRRTVRAERERPKTNDNHNAKLTFPLNDPRNVIHSNADYTAKMSAFYDPEIPVENQTFLIPLSHLLRQLQRTMPQNSVIKQAGDWNVI